MKLSNIILSRIAPEVAHRMYVTRPTRHLQKPFGWFKSEKDRELDAACEKAKETTEALKERAQVIKETTETVVGFAKDCKSKWDETGEAIAETGDRIAGSLKEPLKDVVQEACQNTTQNIEDKVAENITERVMKKKEEAEKAKADK